MLKIRLLQRKPWDNADQCEQKSLKLDPNCDDVGPNLRYLIPIEDDHKRWMEHYVLSFAKLVESDAFGMINWVCQTGSGFASPPGRKHASKHLSNLTC